MRMIRLPSVMDRRGNKSHASVYNDVRDGLLTRPVRTGLRAVGWPEYEIDAILAARIAGKSDAEIRELVNRLHAKRAELATV